jgi:hypothetical protein
MGNTEGGNQKEDSGEPRVDREAGRVYTMVLPLKEQSQPTDPKAAMNRTSSLLDEPGVKFNEPVHRGEHPGHVCKFETFARGLQYKLAAV